MPRSSLLPPSAVLLLVAAPLVAGACLPSRRWPKEQAQNQPPPPPTWTTTAPPPTAQPTAAATPAPTPLPPPPVASSTASAPRPRLRLPIPGVVLRPAPTATATTTSTAPSGSTPQAPGCGEVVVDGVTVPLDCFQKDYARVDGASQALSRSNLAANTAQLPEYIDHRRDGVEGPIRAQGKVGDGVAMALAGALDQALRRGGGGGFQAVSALQLWARSPKPLLGPLVKASLGKGIASEQTLPYAEARACSWASAEASRVCKPAKTEAPAGADLDKAEASPSAMLNEVVEIDGANGDLVRETLAKNQDVLLALRVDPEAWKAVVKTADPEPLIPDYTGSSAVHAVTIVGYALQEKQWFYLVKNSWGAGWGAGGYAWLQESTLKRNYLGAYVVQASAAGAPSAGTQPTTCPAGQVPDAVTKQCTPPCADKSPRVNGVCADPKSGACPPGFVNTSGKCVVAAPDQTGFDPKTGIAYACGPAGCTYTWKKGTLGCQQDACSLSCPAPKFLAAVNPVSKTVSCTE